MKRLISTLLVAITALSTFVFVGCGDNGINKNMTQLYVYSYNGGVGNEWLTQTIAAFEDAYKDVSFEEGKTGVQVIADKALKITGKTMIDTIAASEYEVIFNEGITYNNWVLQNKFLDITDVVQEADASGKSIEDRLSDTQKTVLSQHGGKYYAVPHYEAFRGVMFDEDLFREQNFYFADDRTYGNFILNANQRKSCGPDGEYDTYDDGLPSSVEEFFLLMDEMLEKDITPFIWSGEQEAYPLFLLSAFADTFAGVDQAQLDYSFGVGAAAGKNVADIVTGIRKTGDTFSRDAGTGELLSVPYTVTTTQTPVTERNGYLLKQTEAKFRALEFLFGIFNKSDYYVRDGMATATHSNRDAQEDFIFSKFEAGNKGVKRVAMIIEGTFWEVEAKDSFDLSEETFASGTTDRSFGMMPMPVRYDGTVREGEGHKQVLNNYINAYCGINANIKPHKIDLAKTFVRFCYSDDMLNLFTRVTGMKKGVEYPIYDATLGQMSKFYRNVLRLREESDVIFMNSTSNLFKNRENALVDYETFWATEIDGAEYNYPILAFKGNKKNPKAYFEGMALDESYWTTTYGDYFSA